MIASIPTSFNPSDYEFLLKSVIEGNTVSKAESLKRFNTLVTTDKKQFTIYAKRVVLAIQDLLLEPKVPHPLIIGRYQPARQHPRPRNHQFQPSRN